ncbi:MAG: hypothetical protein AMK73_05045 [Planctomycetes bacterium SM23_32]|nr:MAG: hypothetical protein AMK73_05045 [Planctomycetes bacterium SM23_32]
MSDGRRWDNVSRGCRVTEATQNVHSGRRALEMFVSRADTSRPSGAGMSRCFEAGFDTVFLRYYARFAEDVDVYHGGAHNGGTIGARAPGIPHACPGVRADGSSKFEVVLDTYRPKVEVPSPGPLVTYVYHMDQAGRWGDQFYPSGRVMPERAHPFGEQFVPRPDFIPRQGRWYCYELMVRANMPGLRDGRVAFWVDGELKGDFPNLRLRSVEWLKSNHVTLGVYTHNTRTVKDITLWWDDVVVATAYVGPQTPEA